MPLIAERDNIPDCLLSIWALCMDDTGSFRAIWETGVPSYTYILISDELEGANQQPRYYMCPAQTHRTDHESGDVRSCFGFRGIRSEQPKARAIDFQLPHHNHIRRRPLRCIVQQYSGL